MAGAVTRFYPKNLPLKTEMDEDKIVVFLYEPPGGVAPVPADASTPVLFFSGEWGYTPLHQDASCDLAARGRYVLGIDSSEYFKKMLPGASLAKDMALFRATLNEAAKRRKDAPVILAGFSWGSGLVPYVLNRAGAQGVAGALLIAPPRNGQAIFRAAIKLKMAVPEEEAFDVAREMARLPPIPVVLMQGSLDDQADAKGLLPSLRGARLLAPIVGGDHQFLVRVSLSAITGDARRGRDRPPGKAGLRSRTCG